MLIANTHNREAAEIQEYCEIEKANADVTYFELFSARNINRTHIGVFTQIWSQLTGMNVMMYYITYVVFKESFDRPVMPLRGLVVEISREGVLGLYRALRVF